MLHAEDLISTEYSGVFAVQAFDTATFANEFPHDVNEQARALGDVRRALGEELGDGGNYSEEWFDEDFSPAVGADDWGWDLHDINGFT